MRWASMAVGLLKPSLPSKLVKPVNAFFPRPTGARSTCASAPPSFHRARIRSSLIGRMIFDAVGPENKN
jgi:hypothetical protein